MTTMELPTYDVDLDRACEGKLNGETIRQMYRRQTQEQRSVI